MDENQLIEKTDLDNARYAFQNAKIELEKAKLKLKQMTIHATIKGTMVNKYVDEGDYITPNTHLFTLAKVDRLQTKIALPEKELIRLKKGQPVQLTLEAFEEKPMLGEISRISPVVDPKTGTIEVTIRIKKLNNPYSKPGMFIKAIITTDRKFQVVLIPKKTLIFEGKENFVFIANKGKAIKRKVKTGYSKGNWIEILHGVKKQDQIISEGQFGLTQGSDIIVLED